MKYTALLTFTVLVLATAQLACTKKEDKAADQTTATQTTSAGTTADVTELKMEDTKAGTGAEAQNGKRVTVHYTGTLTNGTKFDSSKDHGQPFTLTLGQGQVIQGWEKGLLGMKVGGQRKLTIPPSMGYGAQAMGPIPANSTLVFEIELLNVE